MYAPRLTSELGPSMATRQRDPDPARRAGEAGVDDGCRSTGVVAARVHRSGDVCGSDSRAAAMITRQRDPELARACWIGAFADRGRPHSRTRRSVGRRRSRSSAVHRAGSGGGDDMAAVDLGGPVALVVDRLDRHLRDPPPPRPAAPASRAVRAGSRRLARRGCGRLGGRSRVGNRDPVRPAGRDGLVLDLVRGYFENVRTILLVNGRTGDGTRRTGELDHRNRRHADRTQFRGTPVEPSKFPGPGETVTPFSRAGFPLERESGAYCPPKPCIGTQRNSRRPR